MNESGRKKKGEWKRKEVETRGLQEEEEEQEKQGEKEEKARRNRRSWWKR